MPSSKLININITPSSNEGIKSINRSNRILKVDNPSNSSKKFSDIYNQELQNQQKNAQDKLTNCKTTQAKNNKVLSKKTILTTYENDKIDKFDIKTKKLKSSIKLINIKKKQKEYDKLINQTTDIYNQLHNFIFLKLTKKEVRNDKKIRKKSNLLNFIYKNSSVNLNNKKLTNSKYILKFKNTILKLYQIHKSVSRDNKNNLPIIQKIFCYNKQYYKTITKSIKTKNINNKNSTTKISKLNSNNKINNFIKPKIEKVTSKQLYTSKNKTNNINTHAHLSKSLRYTLIEKKYENLKNKTINQKIYLNKFHINQNKYSKKIVSKSNKLDTSKGIKINTSISMTEINKNIITQSSTNNNQIENILNLDKFNNINNISKKQLTLSQDKNNKSAKINTKNKIMNEYDLSNINNVTINSSNNKLNMTNNSHNIIKQVNNFIKDNLNNILINKNMAILHLHPPELGKIKIKLSISNNIVNATFIADHPDIRQILETNLQVLKQQLSQGGLQLNNCFINLNMDSKQFFSNSNRQSYKENNSNNLNISDLDNKNLVNNHLTNQLNRRYKIFKEGIHLII